MKKMTIIGMMLFVVGATSFARGHHHNNNCNYTPCGATYHQNCVVDQNRPRVARKRTPELERIRLVIDEKRLEIRKELIKETPDWNRIEKLNKEIAEEQGRERTANMKSRFEARKNIQNQINN